MVIMIMNNIKMMMMKPILDMKLVWPSALPLALTPIEVSHPESRSNFQFYPHSDDDDNDDDGGGNVVVVV